MNWIWCNAVQRSVDAVAKSGEKKSQSQHLCDADATTCYYLLLLLLLAYILVLIAGNVLMSIEPLNLIKLPLLFFLS